jgi:hypothetical protein
METITTHGTFEEAVSEADEEIRKLARQVRTLIADVFPDVVEVPWPRQQITGYGVGPKKMSEHFCYIGVHSQHVNLGFRARERRPTGGDRGIRLADCQPLVHRVRGAG